MIVLIAEYTVFYDNQMFKHHSPGIVEEICLDRILDALQLSCQLHSFHIIIN